MLHLILQTPQRLGSSPFTFAYQPLHLQILNKNEYFCTTMITVHFYLRYQSIVGQQFFITGNIAELGSNDASKALPLTYFNQDYWFTSIEIDPIEAIEYHYILRGDDGIETAELDTDRTIDSQRFDYQTLELIDTWNYPGQFPNAFYTQPFQQTLLKQSEEPSAKYAVANDTHVFKVKTPALGPDETLCLAGTFGNQGVWHLEPPVLMYKEGNWFTASVYLSNAVFPLSYKYGVWNIKENKLVRYEDGENRILQNNDQEVGLTIVHDGFAHLPDAIFRGAGVAIPVFSLRSANSFGTGEFADIKGLVDWSKSIGLKLIQLLPLNDTTATNTWVDSYPYAAISAFALHPLFINLDKVAGEKHAAITAPLKEKQQALNALPTLDYEQVMAIKYKTLKSLYTAMKKEWAVDENYIAFYEHNKHWLLPYAVFCYLRDEHKSIEFNTWGKNAVYNEAEIKKLAAPKSKTYDKIAVHLFTQYQLHLQLTEAVAYAHANGVVMKGDIPIGVYRNSCDAWFNPKLFNMDAQAGAPPDDFAIKGQNWGFPTYNWQKMQEDGFAWWRQRFEQMSHYFDAFRIDHILGFFRIWSIPMDAVQGIMGKFVPCIPVYVSEFKERGIWFDRNRYCRPLINEVVLRELFGHKADWVKLTFIDNIKQEPYNLKEIYNTQRKIEAWFATQTNVEEWIKEGLFDLVSNVILFEEDSTPEATGQQFHFRIGMENTTSFRYLDTNTQVQLKELYINYFYRRQDAFWKKQAMQKLPALKASTNMLICGEDLGMVPDCVPGVMKDLGLLSLEIQRMPKDSTTQFFHPRNAPYLSVVTPSTHDMSTVRGWWQEDRVGTQTFYNQELGEWGEAPYYCEPWIAKKIMEQHLYSPAMWSIFQLQDMMGIDGNLRRENPEDERINVPANPKHYWRYRMHISLEALLEKENFNTELKTMIQQAKR